ADSPSAREVATVRLPFPDDPGRVAGKNFEAPRLSPGSRNGGGGAGPELDGLFVAEEARGGIGDEPEVPSGLRAIGQDFRARSQEAGNDPEKLLRAKNCVSQIRARPKTIWQSKTSCSFAFITAPAARWRKRG